MNTEFLLWLMSIQYFTFFAYETIFAFPCDDTDDALIKSVNDDGMPEYFVELDQQFDIEFSLNVSVRTSSKDVASFPISVTVSYHVCDHGIDSGYCFYNTSWDMPFDTYREFSTLYEFPEYVKGNVMSRPFLFPLRQKIESLILNKNEKEVKDEKNHS